MTGFLWGAIYAAALTLWIIYGPRDTGPQP